MAITKGTYTAYAGDDSSATSVASSSFDSSGAGLLISFAGYEGADTTFTFTDNKGNTWQTAVVRGNVNQFSLGVGMSWCVPTTVGTGHIITCTFGAARTFRRINALNVNGSFNSSDALAATSQSNDGNGGTVDAGSLVTSAAAILVQGYFDNAGQTSTAGTGWTKDSAGTGRHFQSRIEASGGTFDPAFGTNAYDWSTVAMAFKETAGGAPASVVPVLHQQMADEWKLPVKDTALAATLLATSKVKNRREALAVLAAYGLLLTGSSRT